MPLTFTYLIISLVIQFESHLQKQRFVVDKERRTVTRRAALSAAGEKHWSGGGRGRLSVCSWAVLCCWLLAAGCQCSAGTAVL